MLYLLVEGCATVKTKFRVSLLVWSEKQVVFLNKSCQLIIISHKHAQNNGTKIKKIAHLLLCSLKQSYGWLIANNIKSN